MKCSIFFLLCLITWKLPSAQNKIVVHPESVKDTINKNIYGHFAEHLGRSIYGGFYVGDTNKTIPNKKRNPP